MSTRAFIAITNKNKIINAAYSRSDSYMSGLGIDLITEYEKGTFEQWVKKQREKYAEYNEECDRIRPEWYKKTSKSRAEDRCEEYGYEYDASKSILSIYYYGKKIATVNRENADFWKLVAQNEGHLYEVLAYDANKMCINYSMEKLYAKLRKMDMQQLQATLDAKSNIVFEVTDDHCCDVWHRSDQPGYKKFVKVHKNGRQIEFICSKDWGKWRIHLQLPFFRICILSDFRTETSAMNGLRKLLNAKPESFINFANAYEEVEHSHKLIREASETERHDVVNSASEQILALWNKSGWFTANESFCPNAIIREYRNLERRLSA